MPIDNNNNNNNNFIWVLNFPVSSMDFTNKLIYIYDTQSSGWYKYTEYLDEWGGIIRIVYRLKC